MTWFGLIIASIALRARASSAFRVEVQAARRFAREFGACPRVARIREEKRWSRKILFCRSCPCRWPGSASRGKNTPIAIRGEALLTKNVNRANAQRHTCLKEGAGRVQGSQHRLVRAARARAPAGGGESGRASLFLKGGAARQEFFLLTKCRHAGATSDGSRQPLPWEMHSSAPIQRGNRQPGA